MKRINSRLRLRALCEGAVFVALAQILGYIKLFALPNGGSVTLNMLPIFIYCVRWGFYPGILASVSFSILQLLLDGAYAWGWQSIVGDYIIAYSVLGIAGLFHGKKNGLITGTFVGSVCRFLVAWYVGAVVWGEYMPDTFFGLTMTSPWFYSALYNGSYLTVNMLLCLIAGYFINKSLGKYMR